jgi:hypothetical protein
LGRSETVKYKYTPTRFVSETSRYNKKRADHAVAFISQLCHTPPTATTQDTLPTAESDTIHEPEPAVAEQVEDLT